MAVDGEVSINTPDAASENVVKDNIQLAHTQVKRDNAPERSDISALLGEGKEPSLEDIRDFDKDAQESEDPLEREIRINQVNTKPENTGEVERARPVTHMGEGEYMDERRTSTKDALDYFVNVSNAVTEWPGMKEEERAKVDAKWNEFIASRRPDVLDYAKDYPALRSRLDILLGKGLDAAKNESASVEPGSAPSLSDVSVDEAPGENAKTEPEPPETPPVDLSKLNDPDAISPVSDEKDSSTSPAEDKDANGTTAFPEEDKKPVIDPNYKPRGPYFGKIDEYEGPGTFNNAIMTEKEKHDLAKAQAKEKAKAAGDTRSRWQKLKDRVSGKKLIAEVPQRPDETTAFPAEAVSTPFPEEAKSAPAEENEPTTVAEYNAAMDSVKGDLKVLWSSIPEDKKTDKLVVRINEDDGGDIDKYFAARTEVYKQDMKDSTELEQLKGLYKEAKFARDRVVEMVGKDKAEQIMNEARIAASVAKDASEGEVSEPVVETPAEEAVSSPAESGAAPTEPVATSPEPSLNGASAPEAANADEKEEIKQIQESIKNNPHYGEENLILVGKDGNKTELNAKQMLELNPEGDKFVIKWENVGSDTFAKVYDPANLQQVIDTKGNVMFDRALMNGAGATSEATKPDEI